MSTNDINLTCNSVWSRRLCPLSESTDTVELGEKRNSYSDYKEAHASPANRYKDVLYMYALNGSFAKKALSNLSRWNDVAATHI